VSHNPPLQRIPVGIVAERRRAISQWTDFVWRPVTALAGVPDTPAWTRLSGDDELALYYVGTAEVELYESEASNYRDNLVSGTPQLWVALRPTDADPTQRQTRKRAEVAERRQQKADAALRASIVELETRIAEHEGAIRALETTMAAPGFYDDRNAARPLVDRHQALMWEVGALMQRWEALQRSLTGISS